MARVNVNVDLNRVEGDLEIQLVLEDGVVLEARTVGSLYRGFEQILVGRAPRDALVITPRVCGICGTAHLYSAVMALENAWGLAVPANAIRIRNLCLMAEGLQNDIRQTFFFFTPDFCNTRYVGHPLYDEVMAAFEPFRGDVYMGALEQSRRAVEIVAHFGGQWPHSSYMLPGGVVTPADERRLLACLTVLDQIRSWYERRIVGLPLQEWLDMGSCEELWTWLETQEGGMSALGLLTRIAHAMELHRQGAGTPHMLSFGSWCDPYDWGPNGGGHLLTGGYFNASNRQIEAFDQRLINEHVRYSWFRPYEGGRHPWEGETVPDYQPGQDRYTWAKAPRYGDSVVQTGPLAELLIGGDALIKAVHAAEGDSAWLRQFARVRRMAVELHRAREMIDGLVNELGGAHFLAPPADCEVDARGCGLLMAARGALGHWIEIKDGVIARYQIVTPTAWNASPRDSRGEPGHWERSLIGTQVRDPEDPVEIGHLIRSHDPCLVCTVHMVNSGARVRFGP